MNRALCILCILIAAPAGAYESSFPNKPGKKPRVLLVVGAQSGATTKAPEDIVVGAGARSVQTGSGDYGFAAPRLQQRSEPKRAVGYDPSVRLGNKRPHS